MATSSFTITFKLPNTTKAVNAFIELLENPKKIKIECNSLSREEEKRSKEKLFNILKSL